MKKIYLVVAAVVSLFLACSVGKSRSLKWIVYYGGDLKKADVEGVDWAIVDQDVDPRPLANGHTKFIAYVSLGEAEDYRDYWQNIKASPILVEQNKNWKGAHLVDMRAREWQDLLFNHTLPKIKNKAFDGVFLDTIDTAAYLEDKDPVRYKGSRAALVDIVKRLRQAYPDFLIVPNNGLEVLLDYGKEIDGVLVEDLHTHYDFEKKRSVKTPADVMASKEKILDAFKRQFKKPVLNVLYENSTATPLAEFAIERSRQKGYEWYLTTIDLMKLGTVSE